MLMTTSLRTASFMTTLLRLRNPEYRASGRRERMRVSNYEEVNGFTQRTQRSITSYQSSMYSKHPALRKNLNTWDLTSSTELTFFSLITTPLLKGRSYFMKRYLLFHSFFQRASSLQNFTKIKIPLARDI